jgi:hypothetical protein
MLPNNGVNVTRRLCGVKVISSGGVETDFTEENKVNEERKMRKMTTNGTG